MQCIECKAENPDGKKYCGDCGALLGKTIPQTVTEAFRDRAVIETEITEAVVERVFKWIKWLGVATSGAVLFFATSLAILGIKSASDVKATIEAGKHEINSLAASGRKDLLPSIDLARAELGSLQATSNDLKVKSDAIKSQLQKYEQVNQKIATLQSDLQTVQGQIAQWYSALTLEVFDQKNWNQLHFTQLEKNDPRLHGEDNQTNWLVEITLKHKPIPASLQIIRMSSTVQPNFIFIDGRKLSFVTYAAEPFRGADTITVQYHAMPD